MILYKYRRDSEYTEKIFTTGKVWLSTPSQLNDPFEGSLHEVDPKWISAKVKELKSAQLAGFVAAASFKDSKDRFFGLSTDEKEKLLATIGAMDFERAYQVYRDFLTDKLGNPPSNLDKLFADLDEQLKTVGIFSLSEVSDDPLMWAHYTDDHKGLCLGFEVRDQSLLADSDHCLKVVYADSLPKMGDEFKHQVLIGIDERARLQSVSRIAFSDSALRAAISTKPVCWQYEREWRYVEPLAGEYPWPAPLVEIVFGVRCSAERRNHYLKLGSEAVPNDVRIYEMRKIANSNSFRRVRLQLLAARSDTHRRTLSASTPSAQDGQREELEKRVTDLLEQDQITAALQAVESAREEIPESAELWRLKGTALGRSEDHQGALGCFDRAIKLKPDFFSAWYQRGVALTALHRYEDAIKSYERASGLQPEDASTLFNLGVILVHLGRYDEAGRHLRAAQTLRHPRAAYVLQQLPQSIEKATPNQKAAPAQRKRKTPS